MVAWRQAFKRVGLHILLLNEARGNESVSTDGPTSLEAWTLRQTCAVTSGLPKHLVEQHQNENDSNNINDCSCLRVLSFHRA